MYPYMSPSRNKCGHRRLFRVITLRKSRRPHKLVEHNLIGCYEYTNIIQQKLHMESGMVSDANKSVSNAIETSMGTNECEQIARISVDTDNAIGGGQDVSMADDSTAANVLILHISDGDHEEKLALLRILTTRYALYAGTDAVGYGDADKSEEIKCLERDHFQITTE